MKELIDISGKRIVLTGSNGLIGRTLVSTLSNAGATLIGIDIADAKTAPENAPYYKCDITNPKALASVAADVQKKYGGIDVLINNAAFNPKVEGSSGTNTFETYPLESWEEEVRVNLTGTMNVSRTFRPLMQKGASVINVVSVYALVAPDQRIYPKGFEKPASYGASKAGVIALTRHLAALWGKDSIRVNAVAFGGIENGQDKAFQKAYSERTPMGRMGRVEETVGIIVYLASDASSYATGATFVLDGGWSAW